MRLDTGRGCPNETWVINPRGGGMGAEEGTTSEVTRLRRAGFSQGPGFMAVISPALWNAEGQGHTVSQAGLCCVLRSTRLQILCSSPCETFRGLQIEVPLSRGFLLHRAEGKVEPAQLRPLL